MYEWDREFIKNNYMPKVIGEFEDYSLSWFCNQMAGDVEKMHQSSAALSVNLIEEERMLSVP